MWCLWDPLWQSHLPCPLSPFCDSSGLVQWGHGMLSPRVGSWLSHLLVVRHGQMLTFWASTSPVWHAWSCHLCRACGGSHRDICPAPVVRLWLHQLPLVCLFKSSLQAVIGFLKTVFVFLDKLARCYSLNCVQISARAGWVLLKNERRVE